MANTVSSFREDCTYSKALFEDKKWPLAIALKIHRLIELQQCNHTEYHPIRSSPLSDPTHNCPRFQLAATGTERNKDQSSPLVLPPAHVPDEHIYFVDLPTGVK
jgi:hypothetical protein